MYIEKEKNKKPSARGQFDFSRKPNQEKIEPKISKPEEEKKLPPPHDMLIEEHSEDVLMAWRAPEFEMLERDQKWYIMMIAILALIVGYAIYTNSIIMAVTFILIGVVGYMYIHHEPRLINFMITEDGVVAGREIYDFENIKSFWIFYESNGKEIISLHTESPLAPYIHIPFTGQDPVKIRELLVDYIPEEKHKPGMMEVVDRLLRL